MDAKDAQQAAQSKAEAPRGISLTANQRKWIWIGLGVLLALRVLMIFWLPFTDTTEARYAEIARKMVETGDWITPQYDYGVPFWAKPPLHTWLSALGMVIFGVGPFGARIFIMGTALGVLALLYGWARREAGRDMALLAVAVTASGLLFFIASAFVMTDMTMVLGTTAAMVGFHRGVSGEGSARRWGLLFFAGLGIGLLAKGPVAVVLTGLPIGLWILIGNRWRLLARLPWLTGLALALAIAAPWYVAAELKTPGFLRYFIIGEHYERFVVSGWQGDLYGAGHARPKGTIWLFWLGTFLPWTLFLGVLLTRMGRVIGAFRSDEAGWYSYLTLWVLAPLLLFTPAANILAAYTLPGLPAAALLLLSLWGAVFGGAGARTRVLFASAMAGMMALYLAVTVLAYTAPDVLNLRSDQRLVAAAEERARDAQLSVWPERSYSAEFYTKGQSRAITGDPALADLAANGRRDAVAVPNALADIAAELLGPTFDRVGKFGHNSLFIEQQAGGDQE